MYILAPNSRF